MTGTQTVTGTIHFALNLNKLASKDNLVVGFYNPTFTGIGFKSLTMTIVMNNVTLTTQTFTSLAAANAYFNNNAVGLGSLSAPSVAQLDINFSETFDNANESYEFGVVVGQAKGPTLDITSAGGVINTQNVTITGTIDLQDKTRLISVYDGTTLIGTTTAAAD